MIGQVSLTHRDLVGAWVVLAQPAVFFVQQRNGLAKNLPLRKVFNVVFQLSNCFSQVKQIVGLQSFDNWVLLVLGEPSQHHISQRV